MSWRTLITAAAIGASMPALAATAGQPAPNFTLTDTQGKAVQLSDFKGKYVVLEWTNPGCPFVRNHYNTRNMQTLQQAWGPRDANRDKWAAHGASYYLKKDAAPMLLTAPTAQDGFLSRKEVLDRYAEQSDRDLSQIDYYTAFGYWKLACIVEGVYARYIGGAMGSTDPKAFEGFKVQVERCAQQAAEAMGRLG